MTLENVQDIYPLSALQTGMLFHSIENPAAGLYVLQIRVNLEGPLDSKRLQAAWKKVVQRHEALRAAFLWEGLEQPLQVIRGTVSVPWQELDLQTDNGSQTEGLVKDWLHKDRARGFDLADAPLMRMALLRLGPQQHRLVWTCHHLLADGWSMVIALRELHELYRAASNNEADSLPPAPPLKTHLAWLQTQDFSANEGFWKHYLDGFRNPTRLPFSTPAAAPAERQHELQGLPLAAETDRALTALARRKKVTVSAIYYAVWGLVLNAYGTANDVVFGSVLSGRGHGLSGLQRAVGLYINTLPIRIQLHAGETLGELIERVHRDLLDLRRLEHTPLGDVARCSGVPAGRALFDSVLVIENHPELGCDEGELRFRNFDPMDQSDFALSIFVMPGASSKLLALYDPARFEPAAMRRLLDQFAYALEHVSDGLQSPATDLPVLPAKEQQLLLQWGLGPELLGVQQATVLDQIAVQVRQNPKQPALIVETGRLSYGELWERSQRYAEALVTRQVRPGDRVAIVLERGGEYVLAMLGVLRAGACYVPLDPSYPVQRIQAMLQDCKPAQIIAEEPQIQRLGLEQERVLPPATLSLAHSGPEAVPLPELQGQDLAYLMYTSGSTGKPKAVMVSHENLLASTMAREQFYAEAPDLFLLLSSFAFDSSVAGIYWPLTCGGALLVSPMALEQDMLALADLIERYEVSHTLCLPALAELLIELAPAQKLKSLRTLVVAGEAVGWQLPERVRNTLPLLRVCNEYGPTEATVWCTMADITAAPKGVAPAIGYPIPGAVLRVLDPQQRPVPIGADGELWVGGAGVAAGYFAQPDISARSFQTLDHSQTRFYRTGDLVRYSEHGALLFKGRQDSQIKLRGHRIELNEIEAVLRSHEAVQEAAALLSPAGQGKPPQLLAFLVPAAGISLTDQMILEHCREQLPRHMVPARIGFCEHLPRLPNGKVDRKALSLLQPMERPGAGGDREPGTRFERAMADIWQRVLAVEQVGLDDDFFALGGDSLKSIRIVALARARELNLAPSEIFEYPTIRELAAVREHRATTSRQPEAAVLEHSLAGATLCLVHGGHRVATQLQELLGDGRSVRLLSDHRDAGALLPGATVQSMAREYLAQINAVQTNPPSVLAGYSIGAPVAFEMARLWQKQGASVPLLLLLDPPDEARYMRSAAGFAGARIKTEAHRNDPRQQGNASVGRVRRTFRQLLGALCSWLRLPMPLSVRHSYVGWVYHRALRRYEATPCEGVPAIIYHGRGVARDSAGRMLWETLLDAEVESYEFQASHTEFVRRPETISAWTRHLKALLSDREDKNRK